MIWRALVAIAGLAVVAAATHVNVMHRGGYGATDAWLVIAVSVLLAVGMGFVATEWRDGRKFGAILLIVCLLAGETYWLLLNTERELQAREDADRPFREVHEKHVKAQKLVDDAKQAKKEADNAALTQAALPGCKVNCAQLLTNAKKDAKTELDNAQSALESLPEDRTSVSLADNLGVSRWAWDLFMASLRGLAIIGGSIAVGLALHPRRHQTASAFVAASTSAEVNVEVPIAKRSSRAARRRALGSSPLAITARPVNEREHVSHFLRIALRPDPDETASLRKLHDKYPVWCREQSVDALPPQELGQHLRSIIDAIGLECVPTGRDVIIRGAALK